MNAQHTAGAEALGCRLQTSVDNYGDGVTTAKSRMEVASLFDIATGTLVASAMHANLDTAISMAFAEARKLRPTRTKEQKAVDRAGHNGREVS
jgi:hypothetical protein